MEVDFSASGASGMFTTPQPRMTEDEKQALKANKEKMAKLVDGVSTYLSDVLFVHQSTSKTRTWPGSCHSWRCHARRSTTCCSC